MKYARLVDLPKTSSDAGPPSLMQRGQLTEGIYPDSFVHIRVRKIRSRKECPSEGIEFLATTQHFSNSQARFKTLDRPPRSRHDSRESKFSTFSKVRHLSCSHRPLFFSPRGYQWS